MATKNNDDPSANRPIGEHRLVHHRWALTIAWTIIIAIAAAWMIFHYNQQANEQAALDARAHFNKDQAFRMWAASHGGVYVPIDARTPPNEYLKHLPDRDITLTSGKKLTLMNPAYMLRQMMEEYSRQYGVKGRIVSLKPFRPENSPDEWERSALEAFENGIKEVFEISSINGEPYLRLIRPMITKKNCLKCHGYQGYKVGDVRGGVGVSVPMSGYITHEREEIRHVVTLLILVWLLGTVGIYIGFQGLTRYYAARKLAEASLQQSEEKHRLFVSSFQGIAYQADIKSYKPYLFEGTVEQFVGYVAQDFMSGSINWGSLIHPDDAAMVHAEVSKLLSEPGYTAITDYRVRHKDGQFRWVRDVGKIIHVNEKDLVQGTVVDITKRKCAEDALRESEEKYRLMMEAMRDAAYICSPEFRIEYMNPKMISRIGRDAIGKSCHKAIYNYDEKCSWCVFDQIQQGEHVEYELADPKDNRYYAIANSPILHSDGTISKLTIFRDITENKAIESQLQQARKMESIGTLAGGIAHDFNNILFMITGNAELALENIPESNPTHANLKEIKTAGLRAAGIVNQLLNFSRNSDQELRPIEAITVIKDALRFLRATIPTTVELRKHLPDTDIAIMADPVQINQILMNLYTNAAQAMEKTGGILEINVENKTLTEDAAGNYPDLTAGEYLKIRVSDTGPGINPEIIGRIFDPYFTTKEFGKGSGLGLAVVHGVVKSHNGAITIDSEPGKGTDFIILFPVIDEKPEVEAKPSDEAPPGYETILFVDDEQAIVNMTAQVLERLGYKVKTETNPIAALELFQSKPDDFDLVITDMTMPRMTGVKLSEKLKAVRPDIPVILATGHSSLIDEGKAKKMGIDAYVMKPILKSDIAMAIRTVLDKRQGK